MSTRYRLIDLLADGLFHSGQALGRHLGISRAAVWKQIQTLAELGLEVHAVRGQGYRLTEAFEPLCEETIRLHLGAPVLPRLQSLEVFQSIDSTNDYLKSRQPDLRGDEISICVAEWQSAGRGRRGRRWVSPYGTNLYLSCAAQVSVSALSSGGLSLALAVAVITALQHSGIEHLGLKWPNDIYYHGRKLAGILLDLSGESGGPFQVVAGIGINLHMPARAARDIDQPWADLSRSGVVIGRNRLTALIIEHLVQTMDLYNEHGLSAFKRDWERLDITSGRLVELQHEQEPMIRGYARGIDDRGALLIEHNGVTRSYHAGEISLRLS